MPIEQGLCEKVVEECLSMWKEKAKSDEVFLRLTKGKERGHRMADFVDETTTALLKAKFTTRYQAGKHGKARSRSMGDVWLLSNGLFNPINVKTGVADTQGQPNLVSLKKLLAALLSDHIDAYYLLFIKFELGQDVIPRVVLCDLLDHLNYATYDDGPGQLMLLEKKFFDQPSIGVSPSTFTQIEKIERLFDMLKDGNRRLIENRNKTIASFEKRISEYKGKESHPIDQAGLKFFDEQD